MKVELIFEKSCPNISAARAQIIRAFNKIKMQPHWQEWEVNDPETPEYARKYGSPTVLVNGCDVSEEEFSSATNACCRIYQPDEGRNSGVPPVAQIVAKFEQAKQQAHST